MEWYDKLITAGCFASGAYFAAKYNASSEAAHELINYIVSVGAFYIGINNITNHIND
jgi:hypothetical protein